MELIFFFKLTWGQRGEKKILTVGNNINKHLKSIVNVIGLLFGEQQEVLAKGLIICTTGC